MGEIKFSYLRAGSFTPKLFATFSRTGNIFLNKHLVLEIDTRANPYCFLAKNANDPNDPAFYLIPTQEEDPKAFTFRKVNGDRYGRIRMPSDMSKKIKVTYKCKAVKNTNPDGTIYYKLTRII